MSASCIALLFLCTVLLAGLAWQWRQGAAREGALLAAVAARQDAVRLLRLTAGELRAPALTLQGHAERGLAAPGAALLAVAQRLLDIAQGLLEETEEPEAERKLANEQFEVGKLLDFVVAQVTTQLGPGSRAWHIADDLRCVRLLADRRAVHQVLLRVVTAAALATRDSGLDRHQRDHPGRRLGAGGKG